MKQGHIGTVELFATTCIMMVHVVFFAMPQILYERVYTGAWILYFLIGLVSIGLFVAIYLPIKRFPGKSLIEICGEVIGKPGQLLMTTFLAGFLLYGTVNYVRAFADNIIITILPTTPLSFIIGFTLLAALIVAYLGLESITRTGLIFSPFIFLGFLLIIGLNLHDADWNLLFPMPGAPIKDFIVNAGLLAPLTYDGISFALLAPYLRKDKNAMKIYAWAAISVTTIITILFVVMETKLFYPSGRLNTLPLHTLVKLIHIGRFVQRIEALYILMFVVAEMLHIILIFYLGALTLAQGLKLNDMRPLVFPWAIIIFALALLPTSSRDFPQFYYTFTNSMIYLSVICGLPLSIYLIALIRKKRGGQDNVETNQ